jgi:hypothetical protein
MELLESVGPRPRQARYQAALRPDMNCSTNSKALPTVVLIQMNAQLQGGTFNSSSRPELRCLVIHPGQRQIRRAARAHSERGGPIVLCNF